MRDLHADIYNLLLVVGKVNRLSVKEWTAGMHPDDKSGELLLWITCSRKGGAVILTRKRVEGGVPGLRGHEVERRRLQSRPYRQAWLCVRNTAEIAIVVRLASVG